MQKITSKDVFYMRRALALAERGTGCVHPNPLVGALLVRGGRILGEGAHEIYGGPHAEVKALRQRPAIAKGATLYVTLEPCAHYGKTPPCSDFIVSKGIRRVMVGACDPNPLVAGRGLAYLKKHGVRVVTGILKKECEELNRDYTHWMKTKRPYVVVKIAQTLDGKIALPTGESKWITGEKSRRYVHRLRASADAILVGVNTVLKDDPRLDVRYGLARRQPLKIVLDSGLKTPPGARLFSGSPKESVLLVTTAGAKRQKIKTLSRKAEILVVPEKRGRVDLEALLRVLGQRGIVRVLVEGGSEVLGEFFSAGKVNEAYFFIAPRVMGGSQSLSSVGGRTARSLKNLYSSLHWDTVRCGDDLIFHGVF